MTEESARQQKAQRALRDAETQQWLDRIRTELTLNEQILLDAGATPEQLHRRVIDASAVLVQALPFVADADPSTFTATLTSPSSSISTAPELTSGMDASRQLVIEADRLRQSTERLALEQKQAARAQDLMAQTYRLMDLLNHTVEGSLSSFPVSFQPAIDELDVLKVCFPRFIKVYNNILID